MRMAEIERVGEVTSGVEAGWIERRQISPPGRARTPDPSPAMRVGDAPLAGVTPATLVCDLGVSPR